MNTIANILTVYVFLFWPTHAFQYGTSSGRRPSLLSRGMKSSSSSSSSTTTTTSSSSSSIERFEQTSLLQTPFTGHDGRSRKTSLSVATLGDGTERRTSWFETLPYFSLESGDDVDAVTKVLSASLLVTSNTVGPSMFTLPEAVGGVGMMWGAAIFFGESTFLLNLLPSFQVKDDDARFI